MSKETEYYKSAGVPMTDKEAAAWKAAAKPGQSETAVSIWIWVVLLVLVVGLAGLLGMRLFGQPHNEIQYIVATPTAGPDYQIRFLCYTNGRQLLPRVTATWIRENGKTVTYSTDETGCTMIPADEPVGVVDHVHQTTHWIWPGSLPVCIDIAGGGIYSGNLCPPG